MKLVSTPYDDVFRTLLNDCSSLIIPVINEVFGENYMGDEKIIFSPNEHFINRQDGNEDERITDTNFEIVGKEVKKYHWECQSSPDSMKIEIITPGGSVSYDIPAMKSQLYTIDEIFRKKLLFLLPFYIFSHENRFEEYNKDTDKLDALKMEYGDIVYRLEKLLDKGEINEYTKCTIVDMSNKVLEHLAKKYKNIREGVKSVMGGKVLDYEAKRIKNEGKLEGKLEMLFDLVNDKLLSVKDAASRAGLTEDAFQEKMHNYRIE